LGGARPAARIRAARGPRVPARARRRRNAQRGRRTGSLPRDLAALARQRIARYGERGARVLRRGPRVLVSPATLVYDGAFHMKRWEDSRRAGGTESNHGWEPRATVSRENLTLYLSLWIPQI